MAGYRDFDEFGRWYANALVRARGRAASPHTVKRKQVLVAQMTNISAPWVFDGRYADAAAPDVFCVLATVLGDRELTVRLLDALDARMSLGAMRTAVFAAKSFTRFAQARGLMEGCALLREDVPPHNPQGPVKLYSARELEVLVTAARGRSLRWWVFVATLVHTGRRVGEVLSYRWEWFHLDADVPHISVPVTKSGKPQLVVLDSFLRNEVFTKEVVSKLETLSERTVRDPKEFPFPWNYQSVLSRFTGFCESVGVPYRGIHSVRHSFVTHQLQRGVPINVVSKLVGHENVGITSRFYDSTTPLTLAHWLE